MKEVNKRLLFCYVATLLLGAINLGYFVCLVLETKFQLASGGILMVIIGNMVAMCIPRIGKRMMIIFANLFILIFAFLYSLFWILHITGNFADSYFMILFFSFILYTASIGVLSFATPLYLKEIVPNEFLISILILYTIFVSIGLSLCRIISYLAFVVIGDENKRLKELLIHSVYALPGFISFNTTLNALLCIQERYTKTIIALWNRE